MAALPSPPFTAIGGIHNFRDIGGYPVIANCSHAANLVVRRNFIFRCAATTTITEDGKRQIQELGITTIFDLRSELEKSMSSLEIDGVQIVSIPIFGDRGFAPADLLLRYQEAGFVGVYSEILDLGGLSFRRFFEHIRDRPSDSCLVQCAVGKDRTGLACMLVLALAGCDDGTIAAEYALTQLGTRELAPQLLAKFSQYPGLAGREEVVRDLLDARPENMLATLDMIKTRYGGVEGYLKEQCGFSNDDIERIRSNLVEERDT